MKVSHWGLYSSPRQKLFSSSFLNLKKRIISNVLIDWWVDGLVAVSVNLQWFPLTSWYPRVRGLSGCRTYVSQFLVWSHVLNSFFHFWQWPFPILEHLKMLNGSGLGKIASMERDLGPWPCLDAQFFIFWHNFLSIFDISEWPYQRLLLLLEKAGCFVVLSLPTIVYWIKILPSKYAVSSF